MDRFRALIENSPDAISLLNAEHEVLCASASTARVSGHEPKELLGRNGLELLDPADRDDSARTLTSGLAQPQCQNRVQTRVCQKNGHWLWVKSTASNLLDEPKVGAIGVNYRTIDTSRAEEIERYERHVEELVRSNARLQAFAHTVAHDLREPLRTISAFTQILVRRAQLERPDQEIAQLIVEGAQRMSTLLEHVLLAATGSFMGSLRPVALDAVVSQAVQNLGAALTSSRATLTVGPLPTVRGDEYDLVRVFQNLISNAVKYRREAELEICITAEHSGQDWVIRIRDNGIGISQEQHYRVFGRFTRLHAEKISGAGIGLAVCKEIVERLGGTIWVESCLGMGSTFCFTVAAERHKNEIVLDSGAVANRESDSRLSFCELEQPQAATSAPSGGD